MSYETRIDEMVGQHVAEFQMEVSLAKKMGGHQSKRAPEMPYGYPAAVYRPLHVCRAPQFKRFVALTGGTLSNGVPRVLSADMVDQYVLGVYNPVRS